MALPTISPEQREEALAKAAEARKVRAAALDEMREGRTSLAALLDSPEPAVQKTKVRTLLLAIPGVGPARADQVMEEIIITPEPPYPGAAAPAA